MNDRYILVGKKPVPEPDLMIWGTWMESSERRVALDIANGVKVSTVFLGLDHSFDRPSINPVLFETMIFGGPHDQEQERYCTWEEAEEGHKAMLARVLQSQVL